MVRLSNELPRVKRSVTKRLALKFCPELVEAYCRAELAKKVEKPNLRAALKNREPWHEEARSLCCDSWGLSGVPDAIMDDIARLAAKWSEAGSEPAGKRQRTLTSFLIGARG